MLYNIYSTENDTIL